MDLQCLGPTFAGFRKRRAGYQIPLQCMNSHRQPTGTNVKRSFLLGRKACACGYDTTADIAMRIDTRANLTLLSFSCQAPQLQAFAQPPRCMSLPGCSYKHHYQALELIPRELPIVHRGALSVVSVWYRCKRKRKKHAHCSLSFVAVSSSANRLCSRRKLRTPTAREFHRLLSSTAETRSKTRYDCHWPALRCCGL